MLKKYGFVFYVTIIVLTTVTSCFASNNTRGKVGFFSSNVPSGDIADIIKWSRLQGYNAETLFPTGGTTFKGQYSDVPIKLNEYNLLWLDIFYNLLEPELPELPEVWRNPQLKQAILEYVKDGGILVVDALAMRYPYDLGIETVPPNRWGQGVTTRIDTLNTITDNKVTGKPDEKLIIFSGDSVYYYSCYADGLRPANGKVLAKQIGFSVISPDICWIVRWDVGKGHIYGLYSIPLFGTKNKTAEGAAKLVSRIYSRAGVFPDPEIFKRAKAESTHLEFKSLDKLKLTPVSDSAAVGTCTAKEPYARVSNKGFVIGNSHIERRLKTDSMLRTDSVWNKLSGEAMPTGSAEFRLTFGKEKEEINIGPEAFLITGKPKVNKQKDGISVEVVLEYKSTPKLRVKVIYAVDKEPYITKKLHITNLENSDLFLREVWLDTLHFDKSVTVVPYPIFAAFARSQEGSLWVCQSLPYSIPIANETQRWLAVAYPPCESIQAGSTYDSELSYLNVAKLTKKMNQPWVMPTQFTPYGPFKDSQTPLDWGEIESCVAWVDSHAISNRPACYWTTAAHDYKELGGYKTSNDWCIINADLLPHIHKDGNEVPGNGEQSLMRIYDRHASYGFTTSMLLPDIGAWQFSTAADKMLTEVLVPYADTHGIDYVSFASIYNGSWFSGMGLVKGKILKSYQNKEDQDWLIDSWTKMIKKYRLTAIWPDQANYKIDISFDEQYGYPGALPLSPWLYKEFKSWERIAKSLFKSKPDLNFGFGHFGNNQAPLWTEFVSHHHWSEAAYLLMQYQQSLNRCPSLTKVKAAHDAHRKEQMRFYKERFMPFRLNVGYNSLRLFAIWVDDEPSHTTRMPSTEFCRYIFLQCLALHTNSFMCGLNYLDISGYFGEREKSFLKKWVNFGKEHVNELSNRPYFPMGEPGYGKVEIYSYGDRGNGWVFLVNPNYLTQKVSLEVTEKIGFKEDGAYAVRELSPYERWCLIKGKPIVKNGQTFDIEVPGYTVKILQLKSAEEIWKDMKHLTAGVELTKYGRILAAPGEKVEYGLFDISIPVKPKELERKDGAVPGSGFRIEVKEWFVRPGKDGEELSEGFNDGQLVNLNASSEISSTFKLSDFAGILIRDLAMDPVADRIELGLSELTVVKRKSSKAIPICKFKDSACQGYWMSASFDLNGVLKKPQIILQIAQPERVNVKMWINGVEQNCERTYNDWCILKPISITNGKNTCVIWIE